MTRTRSGLDTQSEAPERVADTATSSREPLQPQTGPLDRVQPVRMVTTDVFDPEKIRFSMGPVPHLKDDNFHTWFIQFSSRMHVQKLGKLIEPDVEKDGVVTAADPNPQRQAIGKDFLLQLVSEHDYVHVHNAPTVYSALEALKVARHGRPEAYQVKCAAEFLARKLEVNEGIAVFIKDMRSMSNRMKDAGLPIPELLLTVATIIAASANPRYKAQCDSMLGLGMTLAMDHVQSALQAVEMQDSLQQLQVPSALHATGNVSNGKVLAGGLVHASGTSDPAVAALAKRFDVLSSKVGRIASNGGQQQQYNQNQRSPGPERSTFSGGNRSSPYQREDSRGGGNKRWVNVVCSNCNIKGHRWADCSKPCQRCNRRGHITPECRTRPENLPKARANLTLGAELGAGEFGATGYGFMHAGLPLPSPFPFPPPPPSPYDPFQMPPDAYLMGQAGYGGDRRPAEQNPPPRASKFLSPATWILDSGATHHMTGKREWLFDFVPDHTPAASIQAAVDVVLPRAGTGTLRFETTVDGVVHKREVTNVWYAPGLTVNLLSAQQLKLAGCWHVEGRHGDLTDYWFDRDDVHFLRCPMSGGLNVPDWRLHLNRAYLQDAASPEPPSLASVSGICSYSAATHASDPETPELWHQRLGHINYQSLYHLVKHGLVSGVTLHPSGFKPCHNVTCQVCVMAKHNRAPFLPRSERADASMHTLHSDVGVYSEPSIEGGKYGVTLLDEHTDNAEGMVLRHKHEVEGALIGAITRWMTITGRRCTVLFTDRGGEYLGNSFRDWCRTMGITHHKSVPFTARQNGKAERLNETLNNSVRAMLLQYNLPKSLWSHAFLYAVSIHNVSLNKRLMVTPYQAFRRRVPSVRDFRTFGCKVFARTPECRRSKLDPKSQIGIYLGPVTDGPGHKVLCYTPKAKRALPYAVYIFRDVVTFENLMDVCGVQDSSTLQWGGSIPLPIQRPATIATAPRDNSEQATESLSGVPDVAGYRPMTLPQLQLLLAHKPTVTNLSGGNPLVPLAAAPPGQLPAPPSPLRVEALGATEPSIANAPNSNLAPNSHQTAEYTRPHLAPQQIVHSPAVTAARYPVRNRQPTSWLRGGTRDAPADFQPAAHFAFATDMRAAVFNARGNLPGPGQPNQPLLPARAAVLGSAKRSKISDVIPGPIPFVHISPAAPPPCPIIPIPSDIGHVPIPADVQQALTGAFAKHWLGAITSELQSLSHNATWQLVTRQPGMKVIPSKWVFTVKKDADGVPVRFKARLVAGGHRQQEGLDYHETFAPVSRQSTQRVLMSVAAHRGWEVLQLDISTAFLNGDIDTLVYMNQPPGFAEGENLVCKLNQSLYGLKQAPRCWYEKLKEALTELGFSPVSADSSFWVSDANPAIVYLTSVVDDMLVTSPDAATSRSVVDAILARFAGTSGGVAHHYNGVKITWLPQQRAVLLTQQKHVEEMLHQFEPLHDDWAPRKLPVPEGLRLHPEGATLHKHLPDKSPLLDVRRYPYRALIGGLNYIACSTRPDIAYIVNQLARFSNAPTIVHWDVAINVLRYLSGTRTWGILLGHAASPAVAAYVDASHGTGTPDGKPVTGYVIQVHGGSVSWASHTQSLVCTSSTESEYRAMSECAKEVLWLSKILTRFDVPHRPFPIMGDNKGAMDAVANYTHTKHTKHIELHLDFMKERRELGELAFHHIPGAQNRADVLTKALGSKMFDKYCLELGVVPAP